MTEIEGSSKPERKQLDPEAEQALAQAAIARSENRLRSAFALLPKDRAAADVPLTADSSGDHDSDPAPVVAIIGSETHTRIILSDAPPATPASPESASTKVPNSMTNIPPAEGVDDGQGTGKPLSKRRRAQMKPKVPSEANPTSSRDTKPSEPAPKTVSDAAEADPDVLIMKNQQIKKLITDYGDRPECRALLTQLSALGANPDEKAIANIREELKKLAPVVMDPTVGQAPESVQPVRRNIAAPSADAPSSQPDNTSAVKADIPTVVSGEPVAASVPAAATLATLPADVPPAPAVEPPLSRREQQKLEKEAKRAEALRELLERLGGQTEFVLVNPRTKYKVKCQIDASGVITRSGESVDETDWVLDKLTRATPLEVKVKKKAVPVSDAKVTTDPVVPLVVDPDKSVDVPPVPTAAPDKAGGLSDPKPADAAVVPATVDNQGSATRVEQKKAPEPFLEKEGVVYVFRGTDLSVPISRVVREGGKYYFVEENGAPPSGVKRFSPEEYIRERATEEKWQLVSVAGVLVPGATADPATPTGAPVPPAMPPAPDRASGEKLRFTPLQKDEEAFYRGKKGGVTVKGLGGDWYRVIYPSGTTVDGDGAQVERFAKKDEWVPTVEPPVTQEKQENFDLATGDSFIARGADGSLKRVRITAVFKDNNNDSWVDFLTEWDEKRVIKTESRNLKPEEAKQRLRDGHYVREVAATPDALGDKKKSTDLPVLNDTLYEKIIDLAPGEEGTYRTNDRILPIVKIKRVGDQYQMIGADGKPVAGSYYSDRELQQLAKVENWQNVEVPITPSNEQIVPPEEKEAEKNLESLLAEVKEARLAYVRTDYHQKKLWNRITGVFRNLKDKERNDKDTEDAKTRYERALSELFNSQLGELKGLGLSPAELHKKMGEMLMYYKYDEQINLANDRTAVEYENMNLPMKVKRVMEEVGKAYNKLTPTTKIALAAAVLGGAAVAGTAAGAVGAAVGLSAVTVRRVITTLGAGASLDMLSAQYVEKRRKEKVAEEQEEQMAELKILGAPLTSSGKNEAISEDMFEQLGKNVSSDIKSLDRKFQTQKRMKFWRKATVWGAAVGASAFFTYRSLGSGSGVSGGGLSEEELEKRAKAANLRAAAKNVPGTGSPASPGSLLNTPPSDTRSFQPLSPGSAPLKLDSMPGIAPQDIITPGATEAGTPSAGREFLQATDPSFSADAPVATPESSQSVTPRGIANPDTSAPADVKVAPLEKMGSVLQNYTVESTDGKSGLWSILDGRLPDDIPKGAERNRIIASIENVMRKDLASMTPAEQAAAGFPKGSLDLIYKGGVIQFDKFPSLTEAKLEAIMDGESVGVPHVASAIDILPGAPSDIPDVVSPAEKAEILKGFSDGPGGSVETTRGLDTSVAASPETPSPAPPEPTAEMTPSEMVQPANFQEYLEVHPEAAHSYKITLNEIKEATFSLPDVMPRDGVYMAQIEGGYQVGIQGQVYMERVFETHQEFRSGIMNPREYDSRPFPFKSTQVDRLVHLVRAASHPKIFGEAGQVMPGEKVDQYLKRIAALTTVSHKERELAFLLGIGRR